MISIVIPVYNVEDYLERCFQSLKLQSYKNFEVICVNDGSTDQSEMIIREWINKKDINLQLINIENQGVSVARNIGLNNANGKYVCFVDSDDMLSPWYLEHMLRSLEENEKCQLAICKRKIISDDYGKNDVSYEEIKEEAYKYECFLSLDILKMMLYHNISAGIWNVMVKRDFMVDLGMKFEEGYAYSEDLEMVWKLALNSSYIVLLDEKLYLYRVRDGSAMSRFDKRREDGYSLFIQLEDYIKEHRKDFAHDFENYGVAYWVWSTTWQAVKTTSDYKMFKNSIKFMDKKEYFKKLLHYPDSKVRISSFIYICSRWLYYIMMKVYLRYN